MFDSSARRVLISHESAINISSVLSFIAPAGWVGAQKVATPSGQTRPPGPSGRNLDPGRWPDASGRRNIGNLFARWLAGWPAGERRRRTEARCRVHLH